MSDERFEQINRLFRAAERLDPAERVAFLDSVCGHDETLRHEIERLLRADANAPSFLDDERLAQNAAARAAQVTADARPAAGMPPLAPLRQRIGRYRLLRAIASGGMGTVYEAMQENPRRHVAIKVLRGFASESAQRRFEFEAEVLARLRHPGIAQIYEAGRDDDGSGPVPYFAMEYIPGAASIVDFAKAKTLDDAGRVELFALVCDAAQHGHQRGIIHRDLKPDNILVDAEGRPKIIDFGVARAADSNAVLTSAGTVAGQLVGTLHYMSPEQCGGDPEDLDVRSDVYALGVVLYQLLCGRLPYDFDRGSLAEIASAIRDQTPKRPAAVRVGLDADLDTIIMKAIDKERERRYQSAGELAADLRCWLEGKPITARSDSALYVLRKTLARRRGPVLAAVVILVLAVAAVVAGLQARTTRLESRALSWRYGAVVELLMDPEEVGNPFSDYRPTRKQIQWIEDELERRSWDEGQAAELRMGLGISHLKSGEFDAALAEFELALAARERALASPSGEIAETLRYLARVRYQRAEFAEAEDLYGRAMRMETAVYGEHSTQLAQSINGLASCFKRQGRYKEAGPRYREALEMARRFYDDDDPWVCSYLNNLAVYLKELGNYTDAERMFVDALAGLEKHQGKEAYLLRTRRNIGLCRLYQGDAATAHGELLAVFERAERHFGSDHPEIGASHHAMAICHFEQGEVAKAASRCRDAIENRSGRSDRSLGLAESNNLLARILLSQGEPDEAHKRVEIAGDLVGERFEKGHPRQAEVDSTRARLLLETGHVDEALELVDEVLSIQEPLFEPGHPELLWSLDVAMRVHDRLGDADRVREIEQRLSAARP